MKTEYVLGFIFDSNNDYVLLVRKTVPTWQANKYNGIGGKIEMNETPLQAMNREANEEIGAKISWKMFGVVEAENYSMYLFMAHDDITQMMTYQTHVNEPIHISSTHALPQNVIPNLRWLIPMALDDTHIFSNIIGI